MMWKTKTFKTKEAMTKFIAQNEGRMQYREIFVNNGYGVEYKRLLRIG